MNTPKPDATKTPDDKPAPRKVLPRGGLVAPVVSSEERQRFVQGARDPVIGEPHAAPLAPPLPPEQEERRQAPRPPQPAPAAPPAAEPAEVQTPWAHARPDFKQPYALRLPEEMWLQLKWASKNTLPARSMHELITHFTALGLAGLLQEFYYDKLPDAVKAEK